MHNIKLVFKVQRKLTLLLLLALTMQGTAKAHHVGVRAAKLAIQCHLKSSQPDWERLRSVEELR